MPERSNSEWQEVLQGKGPMAEAALADLRSALLHGLRHALASNRVTESDLEDFVQESLIRILSELSSFRGEARFTTWAMKISIRVAFTELRRRRWRDVSLQDMLVDHKLADDASDVLRDRAPDPEQIAIRSVMVATIQRLIMEELTEKQRRAMLAVMVGGMPLQEVAVRMGTNRNALYKLLHDARQRLQRRLQRDGLTSTEILAMFEEE